MPRRKLNIPGYLLHKPSGQARVRINGRDIYLGDFGSEESRRRYGEIIAQYCGGKLIDPFHAQSPTESSISVAELVLAFLKHAQRHYLKDGKPTSEIATLKAAAGPLVELFGLTVAKDFGPLAMKAVREAMVARGWCRTSINSHMSRLRRIFRYGVENELIPGETLAKLKALTPLLRGRTEAVEPKLIRPVGEEIVNAVLPHVSRQVRDMIRLQLLCGCRPEEIVEIRPSDVDREGDVWVYTPRSHKTEHHGRERRIYIGPRGQAVLSPYLEHRPSDRSCFSPAEAMAELGLTRRASRKTKVQPSQVRRGEEARKRKGQRRPAEKYTVDSYRRAIRRGCNAAKVEPWAPNRLRHTRATDLRRRYGIEGAKTVCGHSTLDTTQIYAEVDFEKAKAIMAEVG